MTSRLARGLIAAVLGVAALECALSAFAYRSPIGEEDWPALEDALDPQLPVYLATDWLDPVARMESEQLARIENLARPDLRGVSRFAVVGFAGQAWSDRLQDDLEDLPAPQVEDERDFGALSLTTYSLATGVLQDDLLDQPARLSVRNREGECRGRNGRFTCGRGRNASAKVGPELIEVDYRPRRCLAVDVDDGDEVRVKIPQFAFGDVLRGHVGFGDFNMRLRSDATVSVAVRADGAPLGRWSFGDAQGWAAFAVATPPDANELELVIQPSVRGTWDGQGHRQRPVHRACIEVRSFEEGGA